MVGSTTQSDAHVCPQSSAMFPFKKKKKRKEKLIDLSIHLLNKEVWEKRKRLECFDMCFVENLL